MEVANERDRLLADPAVSSVLSAYASGVAACAGMDIMSTRGMVTTNMLRSIKSFSSRYGTDGALAIVSTAFSPSHRGLYNGKPITASLFTTSFDWMAQALLQEESRKRESAKGFRFI